VEKQAVSAERKQTKFAKKAQKTMCQT